MYIAAIDTGGTKITGAAVDEQGNIYDQIRVENTGRSGKFVIETYSRIYEELSKGYKFSALSIGAGGRLDRKSGVVKSAVAIYSDYIGLNIKKEMEERIGLPVFVDNDCSMALRGELWKGGLSDYRKVASLILGTGVGGAVAVRRGEGSTWKVSQAEFGHFILYPNGKKCLCGQNGCVEKYVSGTALWQSYDQLVQEQQITSGYEFFQLVEQGEQAARTVLNGFKNDLCTCLISIQNIFEVEAVLLGGGLIDTRKYWWDDVLELIESRKNKNLPSMVILPAVNGNQAALLGAAKLAFELLKENRDED
ncbi:MAG: ROK family protein [Eubacteriales bacterium]|nr:ROK family protein [Eubacteriales bacterium]